MQKDDTIKNKHLNLHIYHYAAFIILIIQWREEQYQNSNRTNIPP